MKDHFQQASALLETYRIDALLVTGESDRRYVTGFPSSDGAAVITKQGSWFFTDSRYIEAAENAISGATVQMVDRDHPYSARILEILEACKAEKLGFEEETMSVSEFRAFSGKLPVSIVPSQKLFWELRSRKEEEEIAAMIRAQRIAEEALEEVKPMLRGSRERDIAAELLYRMLKKGAEDKSFDPIVISGKKTSMPHGVPGDDIIGDGFVTVDFGCKVDGYCSDMTRTFCLGQPSEEMIKVYETVLQAQKAGIAAARAGVTGQEIDEAARNVIREAGYGEFFGHAFGHSLGLDIHEAPNASPSNWETMPEGAVISAEPGIYLPGKFGVRIEDVLVLHRDGCTNITKSEKALQIL